MSVGWVRYHPSATHVSQSPWRHRRFARMRSRIVTWSRRKYHRCNPVILFTSRSSICSWLLCITYCIRVRAFRADFVSRVPASARPRLIAFVAAFHFFL